MATWANTTLCTATDVSDYFRDLSFLLATETSDSTLNSQVATKIALVKRDVIRPEVQTLAQTAFPNTIDNLKRLARIRYRQYQQHINGDNDISGVGSLLGSGIGSYESWFQSTSGGIKPRVWHSDGVPGVSTNTSALNGDFGIDTTNDLMYINRSTTAGTPDWDQWTAETAHDYIYDPTVLKQWAIFETALLCINDRAFRNYLSNDRDLLELKDILYEQIHGTKDRRGIKQTALKLLRFDITGDNALSDFESGATGEVFLGFA